MCECACDEDGNLLPRIDEEGITNVGAPPYYGRGWRFDRYLTPRTHFYGEDAPFTHRLRSVIRNHKIWGRKRSIQILRGQR